MLLDGAILILFIKLNKFFLFYSFIFKFLLNGEWFISKIPELFF